MKRISILVILLTALLSGCSHIPKDESVQDLRQFSRDKVSVEIEILLPDSYNSNTDKTYPVIVVLDGYWNKNSFKEASGALRFDNMIPEAIIVTVGYPSSIQDYETQRMWDLTSVYDSGFRAGGNSAELLDILADDVMPWVQERYSIDNNRSVLIGHSLAGLFTLYALYERPDTFTHYAAISPSALWADYALSKIDDAFARKSTSLDSNLYVTYETDEYRPYVAAIESYVQQLKARRYDGLSLTVAQVHGMGHVSMKAEGYMRGILWSFEDIRPQGPSEFEKKNLRALENLRQ